KTFAYLLSVVPDDALLTFPARPGQLRVVPDDALWDETVEAVRQSRQLRHPRHAPRGRPDRRRALAQGLAAALFVGDVHLGADLDGLAHARSSSSCEASSSASVLIQVGWKVISRVPLPPS